MPAQLVARRNTMYIHIGGVLHRQEVGPSSHLADDNILGCYFMQILSL